METGKNTSEMLKELQLCDDFKTFYDENEDYMVKETLSDLLNQLMKRYHLKKAQVVHASEMSEVYAYQIFSGKRVPERKKLLCLAVAMGLPLNEVQTLLKTAGYSTLYVKIPFDSVVIHGICKKFSVIQINQMLFEYGLETLG